MNSYVTFNLLAVENQVIRAIDVECVKDKKDLLFKLHEVNLPDGVGEDISRVYSETLQAVESCVNQHQSNTENNVVIEQAQTQSHEVVEYEFPQGEASEHIQYEEFVEHVKKDKNVFFLFAKESVESQYAIPFDAPIILLSQLDEEANEARQQITHAINNRAQKKLETFQSSALGSPHVYDLDIEDQINLMGLVVADVPHEFRCAPIAEDGLLGKKTMRYHLGTQIKQVYQDALLHKSQVLSEASQLKDRVNACDNYFDIMQLRDELYETLMGY